MNLLHPSSRQQIPLPPMLALPTPYVYSDIFWPEEAFDKFMDKAALSANPMSSHDCGTSVMVIYGENSELAVSKLGDKVWTRVHIPRQGVPNCLPINFDDVVFYRGKYYVVDFTGVVYVCDLNGDKGPSAIAFAPAPSGTEEWIQKYLVEFSGDLLLVQRVRGGDSTPGQSLPDHVVFDSDDEEEEETEESDDYTVKFEVFKLEESSGEEGESDPYGWVKVSSLGNKLLWIGGEQSVSRSDLKGCLKPNCIYFTDEYGGRDTGIFHMDSGKTEPLFQPTSHLR